MKKYSLILIMIMSLCGCAGAQKKATPNARQSENLEMARRLLQYNRVASATELLERVCSAKGVPGVTDEALFRLALLYLDSGGKKDIAEAQQSLEKLIKEYPTSSWRSHSSSIIEVLTMLNRRVKSLRGESQSLKEENQLLAKENKELRLNIEKLKIVDIEQELKLKTKR